MMIMRSIYLLYSKPRCAVRWGLIFLALVGGFCCGWGPADGQSDAHQPLTHYVTQQLTAPLTQARLLEKSFPRGGGSPVSDRCTTLASKAYLEPPFDSFTEIGSASSPHDLTFASLPNAVLSKVLRQTKPVWVVMPKGAMYMIGVVDDGPPPVVGAWRLNPQALHTHMQQMGLADRSGLYNKGAWVSGDVLDLGPDVQSVPLDDGLNLRFTRPTSPPRGDGVIVWGGIVVLSLVGVAIIVWGGLYGLRRRRFVLMKQGFKSHYHHSPMGVYIRYAEGPFLYANPTLATLLGYASVEDFLAATQKKDFYMYDLPSQESAIHQMLESQNDIPELRSELRTQDGHKLWVAEHIKNIQPSSQNGAPRALWESSVKDITHVRIEEKEKRRLEVEDNQANKMEALGTLAGGIAHEINTPVQYIGDNMRFLEQAVNDLLRVVKEHQTLLELAQKYPDLEPACATLTTLIQQIDLPYLVNEMPQAFGQSLDGIERIRKIVYAVKEFSYPASKEKVPTDINHLIDTTAIVTRNQWKYVADVVMQCDPSLPMVPCHVDEINQVILNLIVNAAQAIEEKGSREKGQITITTAAHPESGSVEVRVQDTGVGVPEKLFLTIFDPFFTTKAPGKGTGQGLSLCHSIITKKHGGTIWVESVAGEGAVFILRLPVVDVKKTEEASS